MSSWLGYCPLIRKLITSPALGMLLMLCFAGTAVEARSATGPTKPILAKGPLNEAEVVAQTAYRQLAPGIWYSDRLRSSEKEPIHVLKVDPRQAELVPIFDQQARDLHLADLQQHPRLVAAINSNFFNPTAILGDLKDGDKVWRDDDVPAFDPRSDFWTHLGVLRDGSLELMRGGLRESGDESRYASFVGGLPQLFSPEQGLHIEADIASGAIPRRLPFHGKNLNDAIARNFLGITRDRIALLVVIGSGIHRAKGATFAEGARLMHALGAVEAYILDGGGSSCFYLQGRMVAKAPAKRQMKAFLGARRKK